MQFLSDCCALAAHRIMMSELVGPHSAQPLEGYNFEHQTTGYYLERALGTCIK